MTIGVGGQDLARCGRVARAASLTLRAADAPASKDCSGEAPQAYLDALPIPAALLVELAGIPAIRVANARFDALAIAARSGEACDGGAVLLRNPTIDAAARSFFAAGAEAREFAWSDGEHGDGHDFRVRLARLPQADGAPPRCLLSLVDRTDEIGGERGLRAEMLHDSLTGLPNRAAFSQAVASAIGVDGDEGRFAVLVVDLTRFSRVNESMGSLAGDELIVTVARRLVGALRAGDVLARIGGDEFAILLRLIDGPGDALHAARRIQQAMASPFRLSELELRIDSAIGCAMMNDSIVGVADLVRNAQFALKRAKASGRVEVYHPAEVIAARSRFRLETELRRAIENDSLRLAFQPIIDLQTGCASGFEALARWTHPERGAISPVEFIPVAEESGLIVPLGRWALDAAVHTLAEWDRACAMPLGVNVSVNLSAIQLARDDVGAAVAGALARSGIDGSRLTLELTESAIVRDPERAARVLDTLKSLDTQVAMDDFGTGYSSLASLQRLPIDQLKIDSSFVTGMLGDRDSVAIVRAVLGLADALGMETTAEGIETNELAQTLAALGCSRGQGYFFARPLEREAALRYWLDRNRCATASAAMARARPASGNPSATH